MFRRLLIAVLALIFCQNAVADTVVNTESLRLTFDESGRMRSAIACFPSCSGENVRIQQFGDDSVIDFDTGPGGQWEKSQGREVDHHRLDFRNGAMALTWRIPVRGYRLELEHSGIERMTIRSGEPFRPRAAAGFGNWLEQSRYILLDPGDTSQVGLDETESSEASTDHWVGFRNRYWTLMAAPPAAVSVRFRTGESTVDAEIGVGMAAGDWSFYIGPVESSALIHAAPELSQLLYAGLWFWLRWICFALFYLLGLLQTLIPSWGLAVMALSLAVNLLMTPLSRIADRLQQQVNETEARLAPELQRIRKHHRGEEQAARILALYKTEQVHPLYSLKSLVGVAVVIPVFIGAFDMLAENIHLLNTGFLWISDLSRPDDLLSLPFTLPFFGSELNGLPFLMTGLSLLASALHKPLALSAELRNRQVRNMVLLALAFFVLFYTFPAGMVLYWATNNLVSVIKSLWSRR